MGAIGFDRETDPSGCEPRRRWPR